MRLKLACTGVFVNEAFDTKLSTSCGCSPRKDMRAQEKFRPKDKNGRRDSLIRCSNRAAPLGPIG
jgi:hypothetical protein